MIEPGIYSNMTAKEYHAMTDVVSNSYLGRLARCPAAAKVPQEDTPAMLFGRAFHAIILEGEAKFNESFAVPPAFDRRTKGGKASALAWEELSKGKDMVSGEDHSTILYMADAVHKHPFASKLLSEGVSETSIFWKDAETGIMCKVRPDRIPEGGKGVILDLKSTNDAGEYSFRGDCVKYGYAREGGMYLEGYARATGAKYSDLIFSLIAVEKKPPYRVEVYTLETDFVDWGYGEFHRLLQLEKECRESNHWPHYKNAGAQELMKPAYLRTWEGEDGIV